MRPAWKGVFMLDVRVKLHSFDDDAVIGLVYLNSTVDAFNSRGYVLRGISDWIR